MLATVFVLLAAASAASGTYTLTDDLTHKKFFSAFNFYSSPDPTGGFVQYQDLRGAIKNNLISYKPNSTSIYMGVDSTTRDSKGRASMRLESKKTWNHGLLIADIAHMPASTCGSWPAFWMLGKQEWPVGGEIDILEGVNDQETNAVTLHTSKGCVVSNATDLRGGLGEADNVAAPFTGFMKTDDCDVAAADQDKNVGCSINAPKSLPASAAGAQMGSTATNLFPSYGTTFNKANGGIYAMEWTATFISVWFFPFHSPIYQSLSSQSNPDPSSFGPPLAHFSGAGCDFPARFKDLRIIFNTAFCGQWAGKDWDQSCRKKTGVSTCEQYVREHPEAFEDSFWEIRGLRWFEQ
ncbi:mixed-linked glucanase precursor [Phaeosphaeria sp. MPI-PUGE-AT-0046c]|nr:mixed-linked glucanase precursor [Phaeosphaeria sp. MPI-PUGE-AT-0046c]